MSCLRNDGRVLRVGHKGAAALAPENTIASLAAALELGVDMVEFDVTERGDGELVLAHSHEEAGPGSPTLDEALEFLAREAPAPVSIDLDMKWHGFEERVAQALRRFGLVDRTLVSSFFGGSLATLRGLEPHVATGLSYPWDRHGLSTRRSTASLARGGAKALGVALPFRIGGMMARARASAAMIHYSVLTRSTVERCHALGIPVFAWTIDELKLLHDNLAIGVDGVISNDPRIFGVVDLGRENLLGHASS